jgi:hypothetical protein
MTDTISTLTPSLYTLGQYIQENYAKGYRLAEGSPDSYGWQYQVVMIKGTATEVEIPKKAVGRPKAA